MIFKKIDIKKLFQLMQEHKVSELSLKNGKTAIEIKRDREQGVVNYITERRLSHENISQVKLTNKEDKAVEVSEGEIETSLSGECSVDNYHTVKAPLVGTFYRASSPETDPFVEEGDMIRLGDVLCIVEAMKSMNEIQADVSGIVKKICVNNAQLVEFEQDLFKIEKPD